MPTPLLVFLIACALLGIGALVLVLLFAAAGRVAPPGDSDDLGVEPDEPRFDASRAIARTLDYARAATRDYEPQHRA